jgi:hypothetical protein
MTKDEICGLLRQIHDVLAMQSETNHWAKPTPAEYAMGYAEGFNDACKPNYTALPQRTWVGLTDEDEIDWEEGGTLKDLVKAIEKKLKEKNGY